MFTNGKNDLDFQGGLRGGDSLGVMLVSGIYAKRHSDLQNDAPITSLH